MWMLVGRGVGERRRLLRRSERERERDLARAWFLSSLTGDLRLFCSLSLTSSLSSFFISLSLSFSLSLGSFSFSLRSLLRRTGLLVERERRLGRLRSLSLLELEESDEELLERELLPELELLDERELDELLSEELKKSAVVYHAGEGGSNESCQFMSSQVMSCQVKSSQVRSGFPNGNVSSTHNT